MSSAQCSPGLRAASGTAAGARLDLAACVVSDAIDPESICVIKPDDRLFVRGVAMWKRSDLRALAPTGAIYAPLRDSIAHSVEASMNRDIAAFLTTQVLPGKWQRLQLQAKIVSPRSLPKCSGRSPGARRLCTLRCTQDWGRGKVAFNPSHLATRIFPHPGFHPPNRGWNKVRLGLPLFVHQRTFLHHKRVGVGSLFARSRSQASLTSPSSTCRSTVRRCSPRQGPPTHKPLP